MEPFKKYGMLDRLHRLWSRSVPIWILLIRGHAVPAGMGLPGADTIEMEGMEDLFKIDMAAEAALVQLEAEAKPSNYSIGTKDLLQAS